MSASDERSPSLTLARRGREIAVLLLALASASGARANLRAPRTEPHDGSSALYAATGVQVLREALDFDCRLQNCEIAARYSLRTESAQELTLSFITPGPVAVRVQLAGADVSTERVQSEPLSERERASLSHWHRGHAESQLHTARFRVLLPRGQSDLVIAYTQPGDGEEAGYGYFKDGALTYEQRYEIWPLKEWSLAPDFRLTLRVRYARERKPRLWQRWFGGVYTLRCLDERDGRISPDLPRDRQHVSFERVFTAGQLPDRLLCELGPENLLREAHPEFYSQGVP
jgi:hypothetical protein